LLIKVKSILMFWRYAWILFRRMLYFLLPLTCNITPQLVVACVINAHGCGWFCTTLLFFKSLVSIYISTLTYLCKTRTNPKWVVIFMCGLFYLLCGVGALVWTFGCYIATLWMSFVGAS
jgi:hypothetical protein